VHPGAGRDGVPGEEVVELAAGADEPEVGPRGQLWPVDLDDLSAAVHAQAPVPDPARGRRGVDAHRLELGDRPRGEPVAADLLAGEDRLLQHRDVDPGGGQPVRGRRPGGAGTDDEHVGGPVGDARHGRRGAGHEDDLHSTPAEPG
jgi:hypothetical protein